VENHPVLVSTSRHVTQGMVDVEEESWNPGNRCLSGTSRVVGGDPCELRICVPGGEDVKGVDLSPEDIKAGERAAFTQEGAQIRVRLTSPVARRTRWEVRFK
jgi:hypothetical protein